MGPWRSGGAGGTLSRVHKLLVSCSDSTQSINTSTLCLMPHPQDWLGEASTEQWLIPSYYKTAGKKINK